MTYYDLACAYGRDFKSAKDVKAAWASGKDFAGDHQLGFKPVNINDVPKPCTVVLRYARNTRTAVVNVPIGARAAVPAPKAARVPVLCGCGWGSLAMPENEIPASCPVCGSRIGMHACNDDLVPYLESSDYQRDMED